MLELDITRSAARYDKNSSVTSSSLVRRTASLRSLSLWAACIINTHKTVINTTIAHEIKYKTLQNTTYSYLNIIATKSDRIKCPIKRLELYYQQNLTGLQIFANLNHKSQTTSQKNFIHHNVTNLRPNRGHYSWFRDDVSLLFSTTLLVNFFPRNQRV